VLAIIDIITKTIRLSNRVNESKLPNKASHQRRGTRFNRIRIVANITHILKKRIHQTIQIVKPNKNKKEPTIATDEQIRSETGQEKTANPRDQLSYKGMAETNPPVHPTANENISHPKIKLYIQPWNSYKHIIIQTYPNTSIHELLEQIAEKLAVPTSTLQDNALLKTSRVKIDTSTNEARQVTIDQLDIKNEDTLSLNLRLLGGAKRDRPPIEDEQDNEEESEIDSDSDIESEDNDNSICKEDYTIHQNSTRSYNRSRIPIRTMTFNANGSTKNKQKNTISSEIIANLVRKEKIDILFICDHRSPETTIQQLANTIGTQTGMDTEAIINPVIPVPGQDKYHATVGGTAIILIGKLSQASVKKISSDESGVGFIISAVLTYQENTIPPLALHCLYMFPTSSNGPTTANTRVKSYLRSTTAKKETPITVRKHVNKMILNQVQEIDKNYNNTIHIMGGDFNHSSWDNPTKSKTQLLIHQLRLSNPAWEQEQRQVTKEPNTDAVSQPTATYERVCRTRSKGVKKIARWIDHILVRGDIELTRHRAVRRDHINLFIDHNPLIVELTLPPTFKQHNTKGDEVRKAQKLNSYADVNLHDPTQLQKFQTYLISSANELESGEQFSKISTSTKEEVEIEINKIMKQLVISAEKTAPAIKTNIKSKSGWSPMSELIRRTREALQSIQSNLTKHPSTGPNRQNIRQNIQKVRKNTRRLLETLWNKKHNKAEDGYLFRRLLTTLDPHIPPWQHDIPTLQTNEAEGRDILNILLALSLLKKTTPKDQLQALLMVTIANLTRQTHTKQKIKERKQVNGKLVQESDAVLVGDIRKSITRLNPNKTHKTPFKTMIDETGKVLTNTKTQLRAIEKHSKSHFKHNNKYIQTTKLNENTPENMERIEAILQGDYSQYENSLIPEDSSLQEKTDIRNMLDTMKCKVTEQQANQINAALSKEYTKEEWDDQLYGRKGRTSPGPSHVTYNMIKAAPPIINDYLFQLHKRIHTLGEVPDTWQKRDMALIPKKEPITPKNLRPIMLLEATRKIWLSILANRLDSVMTAQGIFHPAQTGCSKNRGTEDAILTVINCLEDAHERREELHLISFDTSKAFDSPTRYSGLYLAWRRLGVNHQHASYIIRCDENNIIIPKTTHTLLHPGSSKGIHAECGTPQGDSMAGFQWRAIADIAITYLSNHKNEWEAYTYRDSNDLLRETEPVIFVDDMTTISRSEEGCKRILQLQSIIAKILNFNLNTQKTWRMTIKWDVEKKYQVDASSESLEYPNPQNGQRETIRTVKNDELCRILGAHISADLNQEHITKKLRNDMLNTIAYLRKKRAHSNVINTVINQAIMPKFSYQMKFAPLTEEQMSSIFAPLQEYLEDINHINDFPNAVIYGYSAESYLMQFRNLQDYTNGAKYGITRRLLDGHPNYKYVILALIERSTRRKLTWNEWIQDAWVPCYSPTETEDEIETNRIDQKAIYSNIDRHNTSQTWGTSLINWLQEGKLNISLYKGGYTSTPEKLTETPIINMYDEDIDYNNKVDIKERFTRHDLLYILRIYNIRYLEELFSYPFDLHTPYTKENYDLERARFQEWVEKIVQNPFKEFFYRVYEEAATNPNIARGCVRIRPGIIIENENGTASEIINIIVKEDTQEIDLTKREYSMETSQYSNSNRECKILTIPRDQFHESNWNSIHHPMPEYAQVKFRSIHGRNVDKKGWPCKSWTYITLNQAIFPVTYHELPQVDITNHVDRLNLPHDFLQAWTESGQASHNQKEIYTDASVIAPKWQREIEYTIKPSSIGIAIIFGDEYNSQQVPWKDRAVTALRITGEAADMCSYDAELIGATSATALGEINEILDRPRVKINTDCKAIVTKIQKITQNITYDTYSGNDNIDNTHREDLGLQREGFKNNALLKTMLHAHDHYRLHHQPAHAERRKTIKEFSIGEMGNYIADAIAGGHENKLSGMIKHLQIVEMSLDEIKNQLTSVNPIKITLLSNPDIEFQGSATKIQEHVSNNRYMEYINNREENYYGHHRKWVPYSIHIAGKAFEKIGKETYNKIQEVDGISRRSIRRMFYMTTNDKFQNQYYKTKIEDSLKPHKLEDRLEQMSTLEANDLIQTIKHIRENNPEDEETINNLTEELNMRTLPVCPCCSTGDELDMKDSITHLLYECPCEEIKQIREKTIKDLNNTTNHIPAHLHEAYRELLAHMVKNPEEFLSQKDSRRWAAVFHDDIIRSLYEKNTSTKEIIEILTHIQKHTIVGIHKIWKQYCEITHQPNEEDKTKARMKAKKPKRVVKPKTETPPDQPRGLTQYMITRDEENAVKYQRPYQHKKNPGLSLYTHTNPKRRRNQQKAKPLNIQINQPPIIQINKINKLQYSLNPRQTVADTWLLVTHKNKERADKTVQPIPQIHTQNRFSKLDVDELTLQGGIDIPYIHPQKIEAAKKQRQEQERQRRDRTQTNREDALNKQLKNSQKNQRNKEYLTRQHNNMQHRINKMKQHKEEIKYRQLPTQELPQEETSHYRIHRHEISKVEYTKNISHSSITLDMKNYIQNITNKIAHGNPGTGGNCLLLAINQYLQSTNHHPLDTSATRREMIQFYSSNPTGISIQNNMLDKTKHNIEKKLENEWLDEDALIALSHMYNIRFTVYQIITSNKPTIPVYKSMISTINHSIDNTIENQQHLHEIHLLLHDTVHYEILLPINRLDPLSPNNKQHIPNDPPHPTSQSISSQITQPTNRKRSILSILTSEQIYKTKINSNTESNEDHSSIEGVSGNDTEIEGISNPAENTENPPEITDPVLPSTTGKQKRENNQHQQEGLITKFLKVNPDNNKRQLPINTTDEQHPTKKKSISDYFAPGELRGGGPAKERARARAKKRTGRGRGLS
jgi:hypothetical protein